MIRIIFYAVLVVLILSFFGVSLQGIVSSPIGQSNFGYLWNLVLSGLNFIVTFFGAVIMWFTHLFSH